MNPSLSLLYTYLNKISLLYNTLSKDSVSGHIRAGWDRADLEWWVGELCGEKVSSGSETWRSSKYGQKIWSHSMLNNYYGQITCLYELSYFLLVALDNQWEFSYTELLRINVKYPNFPDRTHFLVGSQLSDINRGNEISHFPSLNILQYTLATHNNNSGSSSLLFTLIYTSSSQLEAVEKFWQFWSLSQ